MLLNCAAGIILISPDAAAAIPVFAQGISFMKGGLIGTIILSFGGCIKAVNFSIILLCVTIGWS